MQEHYNELAFFTLNLHDDRFVHQYVVDAFTCQYADDNTKPISLTFALAGLYLFIEKGYSGREVQKFHTLMSKRKMAWPNFIVPSYQELHVDISSVIACNDQNERIELIEKWCAGVWEVNKENHDKVEDLVRNYLGCKK
ncbi:DUF5946 family protein [Lacihabitans soyangensis]|uniref:Uncharacterized protein n=1 Tax=Lacihabitans soyangensis TaxID=869394 RepID=A0AAE3H0C9_9BACT|nr:DUF5946 family protein [Lacihabitans soyangensis]MCP9761741.1 hypothetical protein [Lacihabitans soyangensis]